MTGERFAPFDDLARKLLSANPAEADGSHDTSHLERVWSNAKTIQAAEGGDLEILAAAVLLHDCVQIPKDSPLRGSASRLAATEAQAILAALNWESSRILAVASAIESHSFSAGIAPTTLEARILQDADRLDAIGYIGIARCFYTAGRMSSSLYDPNDPRGDNRTLDDKRFALDHFPIKLLRLTEGFQTLKGLRLARDRELLLREFYDRFLEEVRGGLDARPSD